MQEHEKTVLTLIVIGALIGMSRLLVSNEPLSWRMIVGRTILGSATSTIAGVVLIQFRFKSNCSCCYSLRARHIGKYIHRRVFKEKCK